MDKAVAKKVTREKERAARAERKKAAHAAGKEASPEPLTPKMDAHGDHPETDDEPMDLDDDKDDHSSAISPTGSSSDLKRKREEGAARLGDDGQSSPKKFRTTPPAPPPPPPPPAEDMPTDMEADEFDGTNYGSDSMHTESVDAATPQTGGKELVTDRVKQTDDMTNGHHSPMQLATPPTTTNGSCEHESTDKDRETAPLE
jgi:histone-lysine N-methyltransferase SETD2